MSKKIKWTVLIFLVFLIISLIGISFSYWRFESKQNDQNIASSKCFKVTITNESDAITLTNMHPITDEEGLKSSSYSFTIENTCDTYAMYQVNLEDILDDTITKRLNNKYIKISLNDGTPKVLNTYQSVTPTINNADASFKLTSGSLGPKGSNNDSVNYNLKLWMNYDTPALDEVMSATFKSKISVVSVYTEEDKLTNDITITYNTKATDYTKDGETIDINATSTNYNLIEYSTDNITYTSIDTPSKNVTITKTYTEDKDETIYFRDEMGNLKSKKVVLSKLDQTGPVITVSASSDWGSSNTISITLEDNKSGLKEYQISEKEEIPSTWKSISGNEVNVTETVTSNGIYYIYAKDVLGNISHTSVTVTKIDNIVPVVDFSVTTGNGTAKIDASNSADNESGIAKYEYSVDNGTYYSSVTSSYNFTNLSHGSHTFNVRITDNAGNVNSVSKVASVTVTYTVTYDANGGSGAPASQTKTHGVNLTLSSTKPTRTGYTFLGWSTSSSATSASYSAGSTYSANANATLYAVWRVNTYTITYNANGGSGAPGSQSYTYATSGNINLSSTKPTRTGYTFLGWSLSSGATSASYSAGQAWNRSNASNYTLYAVWQAQTSTYSITAYGGYTGANGVVPFGTICDSGSSKVVSVNQSGSILSWAKGNVASVKATVASNIKITGSLNYKALDGSTWYAYNIQVWRNNAYATHLLNSGEETNCDGSQHTFNLNYTIAVNAGDIVDLRVLGGHDNEGRSRTFYSGTVYFTATAR